MFGFRGPYEAAVDGDRELAAGADVDALAEGAAGATANCAGRSNGGVCDGAETLRHGEVRDDQVVGARNRHRLRGAARRRRRGLCRGAAGSPGRRAGSGGAGVRRADLAQADLEHR